MPLFWLLSGMGMWLALQVLPTMAFLRRRLVRLLVPVMTVGWLVLCPPQVYIESTTDQHYKAPPFVGTFWEFLPHYFTGGAYGFGGWFPVAGLHLWYLFYLALFTLASLPLLRYLTSATGRRVVARLASAADRWWLLLVLGCSLARDRGAPAAGHPDPELGRGWLEARHPLDVPDPRLRALQPMSGCGLQRRSGAGSGSPSRSTTLVPLLFLAMTIGELAWGTPDFAFQWALRTMNGWVCLLAIIGYGSRYLHRGSRWLRAAGELVLPFYVLHQTAIVLLVYAIRDWPLPIVVAYPLLMTGAFLVCAAGCLVVRRYPVLRFLFGMSKPHPYAASGERRSPLPAAE